MSIYVVDSGRRVITPLKVDPKIKRVEELDSITAIHPLGIHDTGIEHSVSEDEAHQYQNNQQIATSNRRRQPVVANFMSSPLLCLHSDWTLTESLKFLSDHEIKHAPVLKDEEVIGLVNETDLLKASLGETRVGKTGVEKKTVVEKNNSKDLEALCEPYMVVEGHSTVASTCLAMLYRRISAALIRNAAGQVIGILTTNDILKAISRLELDVWT